MPHPLALIWTKNASRDPYKGEIRILGFGGKKIDFKKIIEVFRKKIIII